MQNRQQRLHAALVAAFAPARLVVTDDSAQHAGHAGASVTGETHFSVVMVSDAFIGQTRVARSRAVHALLQAEFNSGLHALALKLATPTEANAS
nr:BolA family protein [Acidisphaera sp. L21]